MALDLSRERYGSKKPANDTYVSGAEIMARAKAAEPVRQANKFISDTNKFYRSVDMDTTGENRFNAADYFEERKKQSDALKQRAATLSLYMNDHMDSFTQESYDSMMQMLSSFDTEMDDVMSRYQPSIDARTGMRAYEDELRAAMERNDQMRANQQSALFAFDPSQPTGFFDKLQQYTDDQSYRSVTDKWTDEERYELGMRQMEDPVRAAEFAANVNSYHNALATEPERQKIREQAAQNLWKNTGKALLASTFSAQDQFMDRMAEYAARGQTTEKDYVTPWDYAQETTGAISQKLNENAIGSDRYNEISGIMQEGLKENGVDPFYRNQDSMQTANDMFEGRGIGDLYNLGYSMAQNTLSRYSFGAIPGVGEAATLANYFASAATSGIDEARRMGADGDQAVASGIAKGTWEVATEVLGLDNLYKMGPAITWGDLFKQLGVQGLFEAFGEGANSALGYLSDYYILGDLSKYAQSVQNYIEQGETEEAARRKAFLDAAKNVGFEALSGAVSGWVSGGIETGYKTGLENQYYRNVNPQTLIDLGMTAGEDTAAFKLAQQMQGQIAEGQKPSGNEKRVLAYNIDLMNLAAQKVDAEMAAANMTAEQIEAMKPTTSEGGNARQISRNETINVDGFAEVKDGKTTVKTDSGTADYSDVSFGTEKQGNQYFAVESLPLLDTEHANKLLHTIQEADAGKDTAEVMAIREAYRLGYMNATTQELRGSDANVLPTNLQDQIYSIAQEQRTVNDSVRATVKAVPTKATGKYKKVVIEGKLSKLNGKRKAEIAYMDRVADEFAGTAVHVYESYKKNGKMYYRDNSGKEQLAPHGKYVNGEIWVDLNSGDKGEGLVLNTFGHEMYHHIEEWNKPKARELAEFVVRELGLESVDKAVQAQIEKARAAGYGEEHFKGMTPEQARNEVYMRAMSDFVADSLETMFTRGDPTKAIANLKKDNQGLFDQIKAFIDEWISKVRAFYSDKTISQEGAAVAQLKNFEQLQQLFMEAMQGAGENYNAALESITPGEAGIMVNAEGDPVAMSTEDGSVMLSIRTYEEDGREAFRDYLDKCVISNRLTEAEAKEMRDGIEEIYNVCKEFKDKYAPFSTWSDAEVIRDTRGRPVFSVVTPNGDYKMNLDFSLVCKKRRTLDAVFNEMSRRGIIDDFELGQKSVVKINEIIRKYGLETACALCFVDAKRFRQASMADSFTRLYNELVESLVPENQKGSIDHFNFSGYETIKKVDGGIDTWDNSKLDFSHLDDVMKRYGKGTVEHKAAKYIKSRPEARKLLLRGDFMSSQGFDAVKTQNKDILKLYNSKKGTGGPKAAFGDVQYLNEIIKKERTWTPSKAYEVGGVRIQSFSDYVPRMVFDYVQMIYDLSARKLPAHAYTKESLFVKQFGLTGVKINMSLIPAVAEGGIAAGLDAKGNYVWAGESFNYDEAVEIQNAEGYTENCGTICVGVSKQHIEKLLRDPNIRMVIPYHKSGLNPIVAHMNKIAEFTDYTNDQRTKGKDGKAVSKDFNFNEAVKRTGDPKAAADEYLKWCADNGYTAKFDEFKGEDNYYKLLEDFTLYDKDGKYVPQREVRAVFPKEGNSFGTMKDLIKAGLEEDAIVEGKRDKNLSSIVDEIQKTLPKTEAEISEEQVKQADRDLEAYSLRNQQPTTREILSQIDISTRKKNEAHFLGQYQENLSNLAEQEPRLAELNAQIKELYKDQKGNLKEITRLQKEQRQVNADVNRLKRLVNAFERSDMGKRLVTEVRAKTRQEQSRAAMKAYKDEQKKLIESMQTEQRIIREELSGTQSVMSIMEDEFVRLAKDLEAKKIDLKTMEEKFLLVSKQYDKDTQKWLREYRSLMSKYRKLDAKNDSNRSKIEQLEEIILQQRQTARAKITQVRETQEVQKQRKHVEDNAKKLMRILTNPTKDAHAPMALQEPLQKFLDSIDFTSNRYASGGSTTIKDRSYINALAKVRDAIKGQRTALTTEDGVFTLDVPPEFTEEIDKHINMVSDATEGLDLTTNRIYEMTSAELKDLNYILNTINKAIRDIDRMHMQGEKARTSGYAKETVQEMESRKPIKGEDGNKYLWGNSTPWYAFHRYGKAGQKIFKGLMQGQAKLSRNIDSVVKFAEATYTNKEVREWERQRHTIQLDSGKTVTMSTAQIMSFWCLSHRDQAIPHMQGGGMRLTTLKKDMDGTNVQKEVVQKEHFTLTLEDVNRINNLLTGRQQEVARKLQQFMQTVGGRFINEISMARWDFMAATETDYFPIQTDDTGRDAKNPDQERTSLFALLNKSFTNAPMKNAKNALVIDSIFNVFANHMSETAEYNAFALPLVDAMKWFNYKERVDIGEGHIKDVSVQKAIEDTLGKNARRYFIDLMTDINSSQKAGRHEDVFGKILGRSKVSSVAWNTRVAIQQLSALPRASMVLKPRYLLSGVSKFRLQHAVEEMQKYSGIALWKSMGYYDLNVARSVERQIKHDTSLLDQFNEKGMWLPGKMDERTWAKIWIATREQIRNDRKLSGEELLQATADLFEDVVYQTQVADSVLTRSSFMRSKSQVIKEATSFMAEPTLATNILMYAFEDYEAGHTTWDKAKRGLMIGFTGYALGSVVNALLGSLSDAWRDDDEYETFWEKYGQALFGSKEKYFLDGNLFSELNPLEKFIFVKDILSVAKGFEPHSSYSKLISSGKDLLNAYQSAMEGKGSKTTYGIVYQTLKYLSTLSGTALSNITREVEDVWNNTFGKVNPDMRLKKYNPDNGEELLNAIQKGTEEDIQRVGGRFENQQKAESALQSAIRAKYVAGEMTAEEAEDLLTTNFDRDDEHEVYWILEEWDYAKENGNTEGYTKYGTFFEAIDSGEDYTAEMDRLMAHGAEASEIRSQISRKYRKQYLENETAREDIREKLRPVYEATGMYADDIEDKFNDWDFEAEYGMTYGEFKAEYREGLVTETEMRGAMKFYGLMQYEIEEGIRGLNDEIKFVNKYDMTLTEMKDAYDHGDISPNQMRSALVFDGMTQKEAREWVEERDIENRLGIDYAKLDDAYKHGDISRTTLRNAIIEHGETPEKADEAMMGYDWLKKNVKKYPDLTISDGKKFAVRIHSDYAPDETLEDYGVSIDAYIEYQRLRPECKGVDANGDGKTDDGTLRDSIFQMIDSLPITSEAKDGLALMSYSAKSIRRNAPWH